MRGEIRTGVARGTRFGGVGDRPLLEAVLDDLSSGRARRVVFVVPSGATWALPAYELALMTSSHLARRGLEGREVTVLTPESAPLALFGRVASASVGELLDRPWHQGGPRDARCGHGGG
jgi:sulfide:quinone oxidoreductase